MRIRKALSASAAALAVTLGVAACQPQPPTPAQMEMIADHMASEVQKQYYWTECSGQNTSAFWSSSGITAHGGCTGAGGVGLFKWSGRLESNGAVTVTSWGK